MISWKKGNAKIFLSRNKNLKYDLNHIKEYIDYCLEKLFGEDLFRFRKIEILISFCSKNQIKKHLYYDDYDKIKDDVFIYGYCIWEDDQKPYKTFNIKIVYSLDEKNFYKTIAHELTHAYQYRMGILYQDFRDNTTVWKGIKYKENTADYNLENLPPWEWDANRKELQLYRGWKIKKAKEKNKQIIKKEN